MDTLFPAGLTDIDLRDNQLREVFQLKIKLNSSVNIRKSGNPFQGIPKALLSSDEQLGNYSNDLDKGAAWLERANILFVGNGRVGKSTLAYCLTNNKAPTEDFDPTMGVELSNVSLFDEEKSLWQVQLWDFAGQEVYHATHRLFFKEQSIYLVLWADSPDPDEDLHHYDLGYWLDLIRSRTDSQQILIIKNQIDKSNISSLYHKELNRSINSDLSSIAISAKQYKHIDKLKLDIASHLTALKKQRAYIPSNWLAVADWLVGQQSPLIEETMFVKYCEDQNISNVSTLLKCLDSICCCLHLKEVKKIVIDPNWVINGVYRLFELKDGVALPPRKIIELSRGEVELDVLTSFYQNDVNDYSPNDIAVLISFMKQANLCFEHPTKKQTFLIPSLLPKTLNNVNDLTYGAHILYCFKLDVLHRLVIESLIIKTAHLASNFDWWFSGIKIELIQPQCSVTFISSIKDKTLTAYIRFSNTFDKENQNNLADANKVLVSIKKILSTISTFKPICETICFADKQWVDVAKVIELRPYGSQNPNVITTNGSFVESSPFLQIIPFEEPDYLPDLIESSNQQPDNYSSYSLYPLTFLQSIMVVSAFLIDFGFVLKSNKESDSDILDRLPALTNHNNAGRHKDNYILDTISVKQWKNEWFLCFEKTLKPKKSFHFATRIINVCKNFISQHWAHKCYIPENIDQLKNIQNKIPDINVKIEDMFLKIANEIIHNPKLTLKRYFDKFSKSGNIVIIQDNNLEQLFANKPDIYTTLSDFIETIQNGR
jgi:small GTP-binding protein